MCAIKGNSREGANRFELKCLVRIMSSISCTRHLTNLKDGRPCDKAKSLAEVQHIKNKHWVVNVDKGLPSLHLESCPLFCLPHQMANCQVSGTVDAEPPQNQVHYDHWHLRMKSPFTLSMTIYPTLLMHLHFPHCHRNSLQPPSQQHRWWSKIIPWNSPHLKIS